MMNLSWIQETNAPRRITLSASAKEWNANNLNGYVILWTIRTCSGLLNKYRPLLQGASLGLGILR